MPRESDSMRQFESIATSCNVDWRTHMPRVISGKEFYTATEVAREVGVVRQTLWRWRHEGKIPAGSRYRDRQILFTRPELDRIREFAHRVEPLVAFDRQRTLFDDQ